MNKLAQSLTSWKVIPFIEIEHRSHIEPLAHLLIEAGLPAIEVSLRSKTAKDAIRALAQIKGLHIGASALCSEHELDLALQLGASFCVSLAFLPSLSAYAISHNLPLMPHIETAGDVLAASHARHRVQKLFPANLIGGMDRLNAFAPLFPDIRFVASGGISYKQIPSYLALPNVIACAGSFLADKAELEAKKWHIIRQRLKNILALAA